MAETSGVRPEAMVVAQAKIYKDFREQKPLGPQPEQPFAENRFREIAAKYANQAHQELTTTVGLDSVKLEPLKAGNSVILDPPERQKLVNHFFSNSNIADYIQKHKFVDYTNQRAVREQKAIQESLDALQTDLDIVVTGSLVTFEFKSTRAMELFKQAYGLNGQEIGGIAGQLPIKSDVVDGKRRTEFSNAVHVNFVNLEADELNKKQNGQDVRQHEQWHSIDGFRQLVYDLELKSSPDFRQTSIDQAPEKTMDRLSKYLYDPKVLLLELQQLRAQAPEIYDHYVGIPLDEAALSKGLKHIQNELGAHIAGFIKEGDPKSVTDEQRVLTAEHLAQSLPQAQGELKVGWWAIENDQGKFVVDMEKVKQQMPDAHPEEGPEMAQMVQEARDEFVADMQIMLDYFCAKDGPASTTIKHAETRLKDSIDGYRQLELVRGDPHEALFELSLMPVSHWKMYAERQGTKNAV